jgi:hypothetical protein
MKPSSNPSTAKKEKTNQKNSREKSVKPKDES